MQRISSIFDNPHFFVDGASADDIRQGSEGDCWFLSALSCLAKIKLENGEHNLVNRVCVAVHEDAGVYGFLFFRDGQWHGEIVDDFLYLKNFNYDAFIIEADTKVNDLVGLVGTNGRQAYFRKFQANSESLYYAQSAHKDETWVPLIEKAFAKTHGDYGAISMGRAGEGIEDLTGGVATRFASADIVSREAFWTDELMHVNKDFLFGLSSGPYINPLDAQGIQKGHAYSILDAQELDEGNIVHRLVKVRNPWGQNEWSGDWSDSSSVWTAERRKRLDHTDSDDGVFWISYQDMLRRYPLIYRVRLFDRLWTVAQQWTTVTVPMLVSDTYGKEFEMSLQKDTRVVVVLAQIDERYFQGLEGIYDYMLSFRIHQKGNPEYLTRCHGSYYGQRSINTEIDLEAGVYDIRLKITAIRNLNRIQPEESIATHWWSRRDKLLRTGFNYDTAHARIQQRTASLVRTPDTSGNRNQNEATQAIGTQESTGSRPVRQSAQLELTGSRAEGDQQRVSDNQQVEGVIRDDPDAGDDPDAEGDQQADANANEVEPETQPETAPQPQLELPNAQPQVPWEAVCMIGLRVYAADPEADLRITISNIEEEVAQMTIEEQFVEQEAAEPDADNPKAEALEPGAEIDEEGHSTLEAEQENVEERTPKKHLSKKERKKMKWHV